ncbi:MAG: membrane dipeptidase [Candidatus Latescibacterota bacterium]
MDILHGTSLEAQKLHRQSIVIDLHADTLLLVFKFGYNLRKKHRNLLPLSPFIYHVDIPRMRSGGVSSIGFAAPLLSFRMNRRPGKVVRGLRKVARWAESMRHWLVMAKSAGAIEDAHRSGLPSFFLTLEGAQGIDTSIEGLREYRELGLLSIAPAHLTRADTAYPSTRRRWKNCPLPKLGFELIEKMEENGLIVDLAHMAERSFIDAVAACKKPPIVSHTGVYGVKPIWRNLSDYEIKCIAGKNGVIGVIFHPGFLARWPLSSLDCIVSHIKYLLKLVGDDVVALGSDFDGWVPGMPTDLRDISHMPRLTERLLREGIPADSIRKILGGNALRVIEEVCG